jgi:hypothetical protein
VTDFLPNIIFVDFEGLGREIPDQVSFRVLHRDIEGNQRHVDLERIQLVLSEEERPAYESG